MVMVMMMIGQVKRSVVMGRNVNDFRLRRMHWVSDGHWDDRTATNDRGECGQLHESPTRRDFHSEEAEQNDNAH